MSLEQTAVTNGENLSQANENTANSDQERRIYLEETKKLIQRNIRPI